MFCNGQTMSWAAYLSIYAILPTQDKPYRLTLYMYATQARMRKEKRWGRVEKVIDYLCTENDGPRGDAHAHTRHIPIFSPFPQKRRKEGGSIYDVRAKGGVNTCPQIYGQTVIDFADDEGEEDKKIPKLGGRHIWKPPKKDNASAPSCSTSSCSPHAASRSSG